MVAGEREHAAACVMEHGYFTSAEKPLGYDYAPKSVFSVERSVCDEVVLPELEIRTQNHLRYG
jgi:hypothetical protein